MWKTPREIILCFLSFIAIPAFGSNEDSVSNHKIVHHISFNTGIDYVASSVEDDIRPKVPSNDKVFVHSSLPVHLKYSFSFSDPTIPNYLPGGYQGIGFGILNYGVTDPKGFSQSRRYIGYPFIAYIFQGGPFKHFGKNLRLTYEWNFGASFGWKPYSESNKMFNLTVGSRVNAYLNLNMNLVWQLDRNVDIFAGVALSHFSNGNTSFPNPGVNQFGLRIGMDYTFNPNEIKRNDIIPDSVNNKKKLEYNISLWGAPRRRVYRGGEEPVLLPGLYASAGISFSPLWRLGNWWKVGGSADIQWDQSSDMKKNYIEGTTTNDIKFTTPSFWRQLSLGISAHAELKMPIFALNVGIGYNLLAPRENRGTYQNITLKTYPCKMIFLNIGYQLRNFHQQSSLMLGLGVTI